MTDPSDVTEPNPRARPDVQSLDRVVGALHDVSNVLTVLLGWVAQARAEDATAEEIARALDVIEHRARAARDLARRAIGAPTNESTAQAARPVDVIVGDAVDALAVEARTSRVRVGVTRTAPGVRVVAAEDVAHILTNLILNALAYAPKESEISVEASATASHAVVEVSDRGPGVPASRVASVFEGDSTRAGGAGVGLRHARTVARLAGGDLELVTGRSGVGACFRLTWPRAAASVPPPPMSQRSATLAGARVLVLEDDAEVAELLETALGARGAVVTVAKTAGELAAASSTTHDAALIDLSPIASDVGGAIAQLRAGSPEVALVFISGSAVGVPDELSGHGGGDSDAGRARPVRWVRKPFEVTEIVSALAEVRQKR